MLIYPQRYAQRVDKIHQKRVKRANVSIIITNHYVAIYGERPGNRHFGDRDGGRRAHMTTTSLRPFLAGFGAASAAAVPAALGGSPQRGPGSQPTTKRSAQTPRTGGMTAVGGISRGGHPPLQIHKGAVSITADRIGSQNTTCLGLGSLRAAKNPELWTPVAPSPDSS